VRSDLSQATIESVLQDRPVRFLAEVGSSNSEALEWARAGAPEGAVVVTDHQTAGRGRWSRSWASAPGALLQFSIVLRPSLALDDLGLVTTALGVACASAIEDVTGLRPSLKWPNDVRLGGRKVAGILVESHLRGADLEAAIAGIGVNVAWSRQQIPHELREIATSLAAENEGRAPPRAELLAAVLSRFWTLYAGLPDSAPELVAQATARSDVLGRGVTVNLSNDDTIEGTALRLLPDGRLELQTSSGLRSLAVGEITQLR
jgi:BirA family transcriptional regulator, biotin operon repressor / biotin---[acetyl-CoA-carboxylase] ligase